MRSTRNPRSTRSTRMDIMRVFQRLRERTRFVHIVRKDFPLPLKSSVTSDPTPMRGRLVVRCVLRNLLKMATSSFMSKWFTWVRGRTSVLSTIKHSVTGTFSPGTSRPNIRISSKSFSEAVCRSNRIIGSVSYQLFKSFVSPENTTTFHHSLGK